MRFKLTNKIVLAFLVIVASFAMTQKVSAATIGNGHFYIDLGVTGNPTNLTGWNNWMDSNNQATMTLPLVDSNGSSTTAVMSLPDVFLNGNTVCSPLVTGNQSGTTVSGIYPASATMDSFYLGDFGAGCADFNATVLISGLSTSSTYTVRAYASRGAAEARNTIYRIGNASSTLAAGTNVSSYSEFTNVSASATGSIQMTVERAPDNTIFGYLGIMEIIGQTALSAPTSVSASAGNATTSVSWSAPLSNGGSVITGYKVYNAATNAVLTTVASTTLSVPFTGLTNGTPYSYYVTATNGSGESASSSVVTATPSIPNLFSPTIDAGVDQTTFYPNHTLTITASSSDGDGDVLTYTYRKVSGPTVLTFGDSVSTTTASTSNVMAVNNLYPGTYVISVTAGDGHNHYATDTLTMQVNPNQVPTVRPAKKIVVLGSSTASGYGPSSYAKGWVNLFDLYSKQYNAGSTLTNLAVSGFATPNVIASGNAGNNITAALALNPDIILINLPSNDFTNGNSTSTIRANFTAIVSAAEAAGVHVWITTSGPRAYGDPNALARAIDTRDWITTTYGDRVIDVWNGFANPDGTIKTEYNQGDAAGGDGIHYNDIGHSILYQRFVDRGIFDAVYPADITNVAASVSGTSATVTWTTSKPTDSKVNFGAASNALTSNASSTATSTSHTITVSNLNQGQTYYFNVASTDALANVATSSVASFTVSQGYTVMFAPTGSGNPSGAGAGGSTSGSSAVPASLGGGSNPGNTTGNGTTPITSSSFPRSLTVGSNGIDVKALQEYLNAKGFTVTLTGAGSKGKETNVFGPATKAALIKFQKANKIVPAVGFFGPVTRSAIGKK